MPEEAECFLGKRAAQSGSPESAVSEWIQRPPGRGRDRFNRVQSASCSAPLTTLPFFTLHRGGHPAMRSWSSPLWEPLPLPLSRGFLDRKSTRLNSSHL